MSKSRVILVTEPTPPSGKPAPDYSSAAEFGEIVTLLPKGFKAIRDPLGAADEIRRRLDEIEFDPEVDSLLWANFADLHNYLTLIAVIAIEFVGDCSRIQTLAWSRDIQRYTKVAIEF